MSLPGKVIAPRERQPKHFLDFAEWKTKGGSVAKPPGPLLDEIQSNDLIRLTPGKNCYTAFL